jgi:tetratricopeptide (TPR) repeat protein
MMRQVLLLISLLVCRLIAFAEPGLSQQLWKEYNESGEEPRQLNALAKLYWHHSAMQESDEADSVLEVGMEHVRQWRDHERLMTAYILYFDLIAGLTTPGAQLHAEEMLELASECGKEECLAKAYASVYRVKSEEGKQAEALEAAKAAYQHALQGGGSTEMVIRYQLRLGDAHMRRYQTMEAFHNYLRASLAADSLEAKPLQYASNGQLADFYTELHDFESAIEYKEKQMGLVSDSNQYMTLTIDLGELYYNSGRHLKASRLMDDVIRYAIRTGQIEMKKVAFMAYRGCLINSGDIKGLHRLYSIQYPKDYAHLAEEDTTLFYRVSAFLKEAEGKTDSALWYYEHAAPRISTEEYGMLMPANFYRRYGQFLLRTKDTAGAVRTLREAYKYALQADNLPFLVSVTGLIDTAQAAMGKTEEAYMFRGLNMLYSLQLAASLNRDDVIKKEIEAERKREELKAEREARRRHRVHALEYTGIAIAIPGAFIFMALVASFEVPRILIKAIGFFSVIFLFEFILLLLENLIGTLTHHDPLGIMTCKVVIAAVLLPLHHYVEEKVVHYFSTHKLLLNSRLSFSRFVARVQIHLRSTKKPVVARATEEVQGH